MTEVKKDLPRLEIRYSWDGRRLPGPAGWVALRRAGARALIEVEARFHDDPPPPGPPGSLDGLWRFEVIELFVAAADSAPGDDETADYTEIELSPHGHHLVLRFAGVRGRSTRIEPVEVRCRVAGDRWRGRLELPLDALPPEPWRANAFAIHGLAGARRYLAATALPGAAPDFHQPGRFPLWSAGED